MPERSAPKSQDRSAVAERLHAAALHLLRRVRAADAAAGLSPPKLSALSVLVFGGAMSLKDLAAAEQVTAPTMSRLVAELSEAGLVAKRADKADARALRIAATPKGRALMEEGRRRRLDVLSARMAHLTKKDLALLDEAAALIARLARR